MSLFTYNSITLPYPFHTAFSQETIYDNMGEEPTDWAYMKADITVQCVLNAAWANSAAGNIAPSTPPSTLMKAIRARLLKPRQALTITFGSNTLLPDIIGKGVDAKNGPQPQSCVITQMTDSTFLMTYRIIAHYWENTDVASDGKTTTVKNKPGNTVLYNRWSETVSIDKRNYSTRTREGKYVIRSDNTAGKIADEVRSQMAIVGVPPGFIRDSAEYTVTPDGLAIKYRIVDREVYLMPPPPAFTATGTYTETSTKFGAVRWGEAHVRLEGRKDSDFDATNTIANLIQTAVSIAASKLIVNGALANAATGDFAYLDNFVVQQDLYDNTVDVRIRARMQPRAGRKSGIASLDVGRMALAPKGSSPGAAPPAYSDRGSAKLLLQAAAYYDPSLVSTTLDETGGQLSAGTPVGRGGTQGS